MDDSVVDFNKKERIRSTIRKKLNINKEDFVIITGGKIDYAKNIHLLMKAVTEINNPKVKLLIFGNLAPEIKDLFKSLNNHSSIRFLGWQSHEDIIKKYESTENYLKKNIEDYKEYLISYKEISQAFKSVLNDLEHNRKFRYLFIKKIRWCIAWLCLTIICISFYKYNYDKKVDSILLC